MFEYGSLLPASSLPLEGRRLRIAAQDGRDYARVLLQSLGAVVEAIAPEDPLDHQVMWAESGAMWLTGRPAQPPCCNPAPIAACAHGALLALAALAPGRVLPHAGRLLGERAAIAGHTRRGAIAPGGACRILPTMDGALAVNLPRPEDWDLLPAWLGGAEVRDWDALGDALAGCRTADQMDTAALLGLAVAPVDPVHPPAVDGTWFRLGYTGNSSTIPNRPPRVVDLTSLWAGPLCTHLFTLLGADVIKVESSRRPDGSRQGPAAFFDLMNGGKRCVALDLAEAEGRAQLLALLRTADIVVESSRPRALRQMGIGAEALVDEVPGLTWISITGYGREGEQGNRIAFGDDAGVAAGLTSALQAAGHGLLFCGDAIADPLTGLHAALAGWASWQAGGGRLLDIALCPVVRHCLRQPSVPLLPVGRIDGEWRLFVNGVHHPVARPLFRRPAFRAPPIGADNGRVLAAMAAS